MTHEDNPTSKTTVQKINLLRYALAQYTIIINSTWIELWTKELKRCMSMLDEEARTYYTQHRRHTTSQQ